MKKVFLSALGISFIFTTLSCNSDGEQVQTITAAELPETAQKIISTHFPDLTFKTIIKQNKPDSDGSLYYVLLSNQFEIEFDIDGNWIDINSEHQSIPWSIVPQKIQEYVKANYRDLDIIKFDKEKNYSEIELSNDLDLIFDLDENFIRTEK